MKIQFSIETLRNLFIKASKKVVNIAIIVVTLIVSLVILGVQSRNTQALRAKSATEIKRNDLLKDIARYEKTIKLYKSIFSKKDASAVMNTINNIARDSKVRVISIKPGNEEKQPLYVRVVFTLTIGVDSYHAVGKFVHKLETQPEAYFIESISIRPQEESNSVNNLIANVTLSIIEFKG